MRGHRTKQETGAGCPRESGAWHLRRGTATRARGLVPKWAKPGQHIGHRLEDLAESEGMEAAHCLLFHTHGDPLTPFKNPQILDPPMETKLEVREGVVNKLFGSASSLNRALVHEHTH